MVTATLSKILSFQPRRMSTATVTIIVAPMVTIAYRLTRGLRVTSANTIRAKIKDTPIACTVPWYNVRCSSKNSNRLTNQPRCIPRGAPRNCSCIQFSTYNRKTCFIETRAKFVLKYLYRVLVRRQLVKEKKKGNTRLIKKRAHTRKRESIHVRAVVFDNKRFNLGRFHLRSCKVCAI